MAGGVAAIVCLTLLAAKPEGTRTATTPPDVAELYRQAAELWKGRASEERTRRMYCEAEERAAIDLAQAWKDAALEKENTIDVPAWVWPVGSAVLVLTFASGFLVATQAER